MIFHKGDIVIRAPGDGTRMKVIGFDIGAAGHSRNDLEILVVCEEALGGNARISSHLPTELELAPSEDIEIDADPEPIDMHDRADRLPIESK